MVAVCCVCWWVGGGAGGASTNDRTSSCQLNAILHVIKAHKPHSILRPRTMRRESDENDVAMRTSLPFERNKRASNTSTDGPLPDDSRTPCNLCKRRGTTKWEYNARQHRRRCRWRRLRRLMSEKNGDIKFAFKCTERKKNKRNEPNENIYSKAKNARAK